MKKIFTTTLIISSIVLTPALRADTATDDTNSENQTEQVQSSNNQETEVDEGTPVGQAANDGSKAARKKQWQNIALAAAAVVVAVTALILVANNDGHKR
jgi:hypothetical protein